MDGQKKVFELRICKKIKHSSDDRGKSKNMDVGGLLVNYVSEVELDVQTLWNLTKKLAMKGAIQDSFLFNSGTRKQTKLDVQSLMNISAHVAVDMTQLPKHNINDRDEKTKFLYRNATEYIRKMEIETL